jgi:hypothetical protein
MCRSKPADPDPTRQGGSADKLRSTKLRTISAKQPVTGKPAWLILSKTQWAEGASEHGGFTPFERGFDWAVDLSAD